MFVRAPQGGDFSPVVSYANRLVCAPSERFGPRVISDYQFVYVASGAGRVAVGPDAHRASAGCLFYYGPGVPHLIEADGADPFVLYGVHFSPDGPLGDRPPDTHPPILRAAMDDRPESGVFALPFPACVRTGMWPLPYFETLAREYEGKPSYASAVLRGTMLQFAAKLLRWCEERRLPAATRVEARIAAVKAMLDERARLPYEARWLEEATAYSHDTVSRRFRERFGQSPHRYHDERRTETAKRLLETSGDTVTGIAELLKFESVHYFCKWFKRRTGESPSAYRRRRRTI